jgi:IclR family transcriptional regulator, acetate operon repressor
VKTLDKSLLVLAALVDTPDVSLTELARQVGVDKVIVYRILKTFAAHRYVVRDDKTRRYRIGPAPLEIAQRFAQANPPHVLLQPRLQMLRDRCGETVHFTTLSGDEILLVSVNQSPNRVRVAGEIGERAPVHCTASGKAFLAFATPALLERLFAARPPRLTPRTIVERRAMRREVELIRRRGYAIDNEEFDVGARAVAAPVFDHIGNCSGCVTIVGPSSRFGDARVKELAKLVRDAAAACTADLQPGTGD